MLSSAYIGARARQCACSHVTLGSRAVLVVARDGCYDDKSGIRATSARDFSLAWITRPTGIQRGISCRDVCWVRLSTLRGSPQSFRAVPGLSLGVDPNCPPHPYPVGLPTPFPDGIQNALSQLEEQLKNGINSTSVVNL